MASIHNNNLLNTATVTQSDTSSSQPPIINSIQPKLAADIQQILNDNGVTSYDPHIINMLIELCNRYISELIYDSDDYRVHRNSEKIDLEDVKLSLQVRGTYNNTHKPPTRELLYSIAQQRNNVPLPIIPTRTGLLLPPQRYCITKPIYNIKTENLDDKDIQDAITTSSNAITGQATIINNNNSALNGSVNNNNDNSTTQQQQQQTTLNTDDVDDNNNTPSTQTVSNDQSMPQADSNNTNDSAMHTT